VPNKARLQGLPASDRIFGTVGAPAASYGIGGSVMAAIFRFRGRSRGKRTRRQKTGRAGERTAERYLKQHGHRILARNVTYRQGEVDLVTHEKRSGTICFVEVRSRALDGEADAGVEPEETITAAKRRRIIAAAKTFLTQRRAADRPVRFDVITVRFAGDGRGRPDIRHYPAAFDTTGRLT